MRYILIGLVLFTLPLMMLYQAIVSQWLVSIPMTVIMIVAGFLFVSVSAYMAGLVGSSNNPVSGITIATILFAALVLAAIMGRDSSIGAVAAIMIGAVVCCAACIGGDNLQDLKCGYLLGATPWKQQLMLAIGGVSSALVMAPVLSLLAQAYGIGVPTAEHPNPLLAPQAILATLDGLILLAVPLLSRSRPTGVLCLSRRAGRPFDRYVDLRLSGLPQTTADAVLTKGFHLDPALSFFHCLLQGFFQHPGRNPDAVFFAGYGMNAFATHELFSKFRPHI